MKIFYYSSRRVINVFWAALLIGFFSLLVSCGAGSKNDEETNQIGSAGGSITSQDNLAKINIPAQSLSQTVTINIEKSETFPAGVLPDWVYDITPDGLLFTIPATLSIQYQESKLPAGTNEDELWLAKLSQGQWVRVATSQVDTASNTITAELNSFSLYGIGIGELSDANEQTIDQTGGILNSDNGLVLLEVPDGALSSEQILSVIQSLEYPPGVLKDTVYTFGPDGLLFDKAAKLTIQYDEINLPETMSEDSLWIGELINGNWRRISDSIVNTDANTVSADITGFSTFGIGGGDELVDVSSTVYVVDSVVDGRTDQFIELSEALDYLNTNLEVAETGKIIIQTNRDLEVTNITLLRTILFELEEGYTGKIKGPGSSPLVINSNVSLGLSGMSFVNAGGLQINAIGNLNLINNNLPSTMVTYSGVSEKLTYNAKAIAARDNGLAGGSWSVEKNKIAGPLNLFTSAGFGLNLDLGENSAPAINYNGVAAAGTNFHVFKNVTEDLTLGITAGAKAEVKVDNHTELQSVNAILTMLENSELKMEVIHSLTANVELDGVGTAWADFKSNNIGSMEAVIGAGTKINFKDDESEYDEYKIHALTGSIEASLTNIKTKLSYRFDADENTKVNLDLGAGVDFSGIGFINAKGELTYVFHDEAKLKSFFEIKASGDTVNGTFGKFSSTGGISLDYDLVSGAIITQFGPDATFQDGSLSVNMQETADALMKFDNALFVGVAVDLSKLIFGSEKPQLSPPNRPKSFSRANGTEKGIFFKDSVFTNPIAGAPGIAVSNLSQNVTIENCRFSGSDGLAIGIGVLNGNVTLTDNTINDAGISLADIKGSINLRNNTVKADTATIGLTVAFTDTVNVEGGEISAINSVIAVADSVIQIDGTKLSGIMTIGGGEALPSRIGLKNVSFSSTSSIIDATGRAGGLYNDPMADGNSGLNPNLINSLIDWNEPHPCADYPPDRNIKNDAGECLVEGISPPG